MKSATARRLLLLGVSLAGAGALLAYPVRFSEDLGELVTVETIDLDSFAPRPPSRPVRLLFIHHSCGGRWLAPVGPDRGEASIYLSAVNGGALRDRLEADGYEVHEASYGSLGEKTDIFDWPPKFQDHMEAVLTCDRQDTYYRDGRRNEVVVFKSCFGNNRFAARGHAPGNPRGPELTVENAKAVYRSLLPMFARQPGTLFVAVTAPPLALDADPLWKTLARRVLGRLDLRASGPLAREFNNWLKDAEAGWLSSYEGSNVAVFDLYDVLTEDGVSNFSRYGSGPDGRDSHPNLAGNRSATEAFAPFLHRVVRRAGLADEPAGVPAAEEGALARASQES